MGECEAPLHVLLLPFPAQGHINPFMQLAQILVNNNVHQVTFVNTEHNHDRIARHLHTTDDRIRFVSVPDGLPPDHGRMQLLHEFVQSWKEHGPRHLDTVIQDAKDSSSPVSVIIADGNSSTIVNDVAQKHQIPWYAFWTHSAVAWAAYYATPLLKQQGVIPLPEEETAKRRRMNELVVGCLDALEDLRVRDLPTFFVINDDANRYLVKWVDKECELTHSAKGVILNTWDDLEGEAVEELNKSFANKVSTVGPLILLANTVPISISLWEEKPTCLEWLDKQPSRSVIYVGFGSIASLKESQLEELAWGLQMSGQPFLWVIRPDLVNGKEKRNGVRLPIGFAEKCGDRACFVSWAPQRKVLNHPSVAGFLTHCGWNSTIEGICGGVPMMCWPYFSEQQTNRRLICERWKCGIELSEEGAHREEIQSAIKRIMHDHELFNGINGIKKEENGVTANLVGNVTKYRDSAIKAVSEGGSSHANIQAFIRKVVAHV